MADGVTFRLFWRVRSIFLIAHERLIQCILQKLDAPITKNSRAVAEQCAQAEILIEGTTPAFDKEARMLRSEIDLLTIPQIRRRPCPECRSSMRLAWIEPDEKPGHDKRTFECTHCHYLEVVLVKYR